VSRPVADTPAPRFEDGPDYVQSLERGLAVIRALGSGGQTLSELAAATALSRAVVRRQLLTLAHLGYVRQEDRRFALSARVLELGFGYLGSLGYTELAREPMQSLAQRINESCSIGVLDGTDVVYVQRVSVSKVMTVALAIGARLPAWCTSMGRVLLGALPESELDARLSGIAPARFTSHTCIDPRELRRRIAQARADDYAYIEQELERGLCSVAVPLRDRENQVAAALNVGMSYRENARGRALAEVLPALRETAQAIQRLAGTHLRTESRALRGLPRSP
jgi:IclR family pca regulon transcriptional regulator